MEQRSASHPRDRSIWFNAIRRPVLSHTATLMLCQVRELARLPDPRSFGPSKGKALSCPNLSWCALVPHLAARSHAQLRRQDTSPNKRRQTSKNASSLQNHCCHSGHRERKYQRRGHLPMRTSRRTTAPLCASSRAAYTNVIGFSRASPRISPSISDFS